MDEGCGEDVFGGVESECQKVGDQSLWEGIHDQHFQGNKVREEQLLDKSSLCCNKSMASRHERARDRCSMGASHTPCQLRTKSPLGGRTMLSDQSLDRMRTTETQHVGSDEAWMVSGEW